MLKHVTPDEFDAVVSFRTSHATFEALHARHKKLGLHAQINVLRKALDVYYEPSTPMSTTTREIWDLYECFRRMGKIDEDMILSIFLINALGQHYPHLQSLIHSMTHNPHYTASTTLRRLELKTLLEERRAKLGFQPLAAALIAINRQGKPLVTVTCSNCK